MFKKEIDIIKGGKKMIKKIVPLKALVSFLALLLVISPVLAEAPSMNTYVKTEGGASNPEAYSVNFTAYYNGDDNYIQTEDSWDKNTADLGYVASWGMARVSPSQVTGDQGNQPYDIWLAYSGTAGKQANHAAGTIPASGTGYTSPGTSASPLILAGANYLEPPTGFSVFANDGQLLLRWDSVSGATGYRIYKRPAAGQQAQEIVYEKAATIASGATTSTVLTGLTNGTTYEYIMVASDATRRSAHTSAVSGIPANVSVPTFSTVSPANSATIEANITINGTNFGATQGSVYVNGVGVDSVSSWSATRIIAKISSLTPIASGEIIVATAGKLYVSTPYQVKSYISGVAWDTSTANNAANVGYVDGVMIISGKGFGGTEAGSPTPPAGCSVEVLLLVSTSTYRTVPIYWWSKNSITIGIPYASGLITKAGLAATKRVKVITPTNSAIVSGLNIKPKVVSLVQLEGVPGSTLDIRTSGTDTIISGNKVYFTDAAGVSAEAVITRITAGNPAAANQVTTLEVWVPAGRADGAYDIKVVCASLESNAYYTWDLSRKVTFAVQNIMTTTANLAYQSEVLAENWLAIPYNNAVGSGSVTLATTDDLVRSLGIAYTPAANDLITIIGRDNSGQTTVGPIQYMYLGGAWDSAGQPAITLQIGGMYKVTISNPGKSPFSVNWTVSGSKKIPTISFGYQSDALGENWLSIPSDGVAIADTQALASSLGAKITPQNGDLLTIISRNNSTQANIGPIQYMYNGGLWDAGGQAALPATIGSAWSVALSRPTPTPVNVTWP